MTMFRMAVVGAVLVATMGFFSLRQATTASNTLPDATSGSQVLSLGPAALQPYACRDLMAVRVIRGSGLVAGTKAGDLVIGSPSNDELAGRDGADCLVGGDGDDVLDGGTGADVCIGGPGNDVFFECAVVIQ